MSLNQPPPQAYTRDTLAAAFEWLQDQPASVHEIAGNADALVSLYLQTKRRPAGASATNGNSASTTAVSQESVNAFKNDLRSLAEGMKQFDDVKDVKPTRQHNPPAPAAQTQVTAAAVQAPTSTTQTPPAQTFAQAYTTAPVAQPTASGAALDVKSLEMIRTVQSRFNLSSESEALRLLIATGFDKIREILPKG